MEHGVVGYENTWQLQPVNPANYMARDQYRNNGNAFVNQTTSSTKNANSNSTTTNNNPSRPQRRIQTSLMIPDDGNYDVDKIPMTPSLASMTPRSRSVTIGQILLARALVSEVLGERDFAPLSHKEVDAAPTPRHMNKPREDGYVSSPNTVSKLPRSPPIVPTAPTVAVPAIPPSPKLAAPSPNSASKLSKEEFQALVNARVKRSIMQRNVQPPATVPEKQLEPSKKATNRFNTVYRTPGGQTIAFKDTGKNTPPTPRFGGESSSRPVDVEWSAYEAVHQSPEIRPVSSQTWRVTPAHSERSEPLWSEKVIPPSINRDYHAASTLNSFYLNRPQEANVTSQSFELKFGSGF
jgi:hypothetical protein